MEKTYQVSESELIELIHDSMKLCALENGGVDNWVGYSDSICDFEEANGDELYELARKELENYSEVN
jgi:hypothetical protein